MSNNDKVGTATAVINQKEYLKKYLNIGADKDKKKKKKRSRIMKDRLKIIDDNIDVITTTETLTVNELNDFLTQEDAPQVVGMIDDRPLALRLDDYRKNSKWKLVGSDDEQIDSIPSAENRRKNNHDSDSDKSPPRRNKNKGYDSDLSPNRPKRHNDSDISPPRVSRKQNYDSNASPKRKNYKCQKNSDSDTSPIRKNKRYEPIKNKYADASPLRRSHKTDVSPPRKKYYQSNKNSDSDASPIRKNLKTGLSPPRKKYYQSNKDSDSDASPGRRNNLVNKVNVSPKTKNPVSGNKLDDRSSGNRSRKSRWAEASPPRSVEAEGHVRDKRQDKYEERRKFNDSKKAFNDDKYKVIKNADKDHFAGPSSSKKMEKTLDGKTAGLQNARDLKHETVSFKKREDDLFKKMTEETSGINAAPVIRDRKTGKKRDFEKEAMEEFEKLKREKEQKQKYDKWGKGLKQVGDIKERVESDLHEMNKPLARYADDQDLENYLKEQERDGDPMLQYIKKKKMSQAVAEGKTMRPAYDGEFMPNRFGVPPGHRWDGVDRSNGYEKQWFAKENAKKAVEEEIYKWSTEDM